MKIAVIHDWLVTFAGAERVLEQILLCYPDADLFSVLDFIPAGERGFLQNKKSNNTLIQKFPFSKRKYRQFLPMMPWAIEKLDLSSYDLILSSSHAVAKGVRKNKNQLHLSYIYTPMRYAWDLREQYLNEVGYNTGLKKKFFNWLLNRLKTWDFENTKHVDELITLSKFIAKRINNNYGRTAKVIYPPVDISSFGLCKDKEEYFLTVSRFVPYKKIDLIVKAFSEMPNKKLLVVGDGPDFKKIKKMAGSNIILLGFKPTSDVVQLMQKAKAFIFAAEEDFGIVVLEAQACGTPVIAYGKGGALETVQGLGKNNPTGVFFESQTTASLQYAVDQLEKNWEKFIPERCRENAFRFRPERFREEYKCFVDEKWDGFIQGKL